MWIILVASNKLQLRLLNIICLECNLQETLVSKIKWWQCQWIRDNIEAFGWRSRIGHPIRRESSGAASIGYHMMSDYSKDLFKRAIYESGSPDSHWSYMTKKQARERSQAFFKAVNCTSYDVDGSSWNAYGNIQPISFLTMNGLMVTSWYFPGLLQRMETSFRILLIICWKKEDSRGRIRLLVSTRMKEHSGYCIQYLVSARITKA